MENIRLLKGDCLELMNDIPDKSIDMILCDLPYGTTQCKWDIIVPLEQLWEQYNRIIKDNGAICLFGTEPFTTKLISSNMKYFKYNWIWKKDRGTGFLNAKKRPLKTHEIISVFYKKQCTYNPQYILKSKKNVRKHYSEKENRTMIYGKCDKPNERGIPIDYGYPKDILEFKSCTSTNKKTTHPTEKPVALLEYLIKTYTNEGETVLDNCMGSCSTGVACLDTHRRFIGIEKEEKYFNMAKERIEHKIKELQY